MDKQRRPVVLGNGQARPLQARAVHPYVAAAHADHVRQLEARSVRATDDAADDLQAAAFHVEQRDGGVGEARADREPRGVLVLGLLEVEHQRRTTDADGRGGLFALAREQHHHARAELAPRLGHGEVGPQVGAVGQVQPRPVEQAVAGSGDSRRGLVGDRLRRDEGRVEGLPQPAVTRRRQRLEVGPQGRGGFAAGGESQDPAGRNSEAGREPGSSTEASGQPVGPEAVAVGDDPLPPPLLDGADAPGACWPAGRSSRRRRRWPPSTTPPRGRPRRRSTAGRPCRGRSAPAGCRRPGPKGPAWPRSRRRGAARPGCARPKRWIAAGAGAWPASPCRAPGTSALAREQAAVGQHVGPRRVEVEAVQALPARLAAVQAHARPFGSLHPGQPDRLARLARPGKGAAGEVQRAALDGEQRRRLAQGLGPLPGELDALDRQRAALARHQHERLVELALGPAVFLRRRQVPDHQGAVALAGADGRARPLLAAGSSKSGRCRGSPPGPTCRPAARRRPRPGCGTRRGRGPPAGP